MSWFARTPVEAVRWVVVDCETSGLDARRDRLLSIGAVAVRAGRIDMADSYGVLVRQEVASAPENILIHGIGGDAQLSGKPVEHAVADFWAYVGDGLPCAFHAPFDSAVLRRALPKRASDRAWLDLAKLAPAVFPGRRERSLDEWLLGLGIVPQARHSAAGDAFATAQLLLVLLAEGRRQGLHSSRDLFAAAGSGRWLPS